ncbi:MAG: GlxA family transcriptional regulator [Pseudomonadota bacterium]|nr:GlxA family transcriptional regulator [Pseudomonadota bacterium]
MAQVSYIAVDTRAPTRIGFLLVENFTMIALASALEPLRMANHLSGQNLYEWQLISAMGREVNASGGVRMLTDQLMHAEHEYDYLFVVAGVNVIENAKQEEIRWLKQQARHKTVLGGLCTGAFLLAQARLLDGYSCSAHWECLAALQEEHPLVYCNKNLFSFDRDRITCSGGDVPLHMMLHLISSHHGAPLASAISDMFVCERVRDSHEPQRLRMESHHFASQPKLAEAVQLMEANIEEPLPIVDIAELSGISRRHLERLFVTYLNCSPSRFYLKLRLERARQLLLQTSSPIVEVATMCGFISAPNFSRSYRKHLGVSPKEERANKRTPTSNIILMEEDVGIVPSNAEQALEIARQEASFGTVEQGVQIDA